MLEKAGIGVEDCKALSKLLSSSTSLKKLSFKDHTGHFSHDDISCYRLPPEAIELVISGLHHNTTLVLLSMRDSQFSFQNTVSLASMLRTNHTLVILSLNRCEIDSDGACQLASSLCTNVTLLELYLYHNPIGVKGATAFAEMLLKNKSLKKLSLVDDSIGERALRN